MIDTQKLSLLTELFNRSESVLVIYAPDALRDHLFTATALYKTLKENTDKSVQLLSPTDLTKAESDIVYLDATKTEIGKKNLCITLNYSEGKVEKITSAIDEEHQKLHLTIRPKKGETPVSSDDVSFSYTGAEADMIILVGVDDLDSLKQLYHGYEGVYSSSALISINSYETQFGNLKLDVLGSSCLSEYVADMLFKLGYELDHEVATNLLAGIDEETDKLESYLATADTFEMVSKLMRNGARRFARKSQEDEKNFSFGNFDSSQENEMSNSDLDEAEDEVFSQKESNHSDENEVLAVSVDEKPESKIQAQKKSKKSKSKKQKNQKKKSQPKPGDLEYVPSGNSPIGG